MPTIEDVRTNKREESGMGQKVEGSLVSTIVYKAIE